MHSINWQRNIVVSEINGTKVVIKKNKIVKEINEYILIFIYTFVSIVLLKPSAPFIIGKFIFANEGKKGREKLNEIGIATPKLIDITKSDIIEEYIDGGNLYNYLQNGGNPEIVFQVGVITHKMHNNGLSFIDNKAQNYLVRNSKIIRTDIGLIQKSISDFAMSLDIGIFLASLLDLDREKYKSIEKSFLEGYRSGNIHRIPSLSIIIRNIASIGLALNHGNLAKNLLNI